MNLDRITNFIHVYLFPLLILLFTLKYIHFYLTTSVPSLLAIPADDAYFYFEIARNFVQIGEITFDRIHLTNGFHPLWLLLEIPVFFFTEGKIVPIRVIGLLSTVFLGFSLYLVLRINADRSLLAESIALLGALGFVSAFIQLNMESSVVVPLSLLLVYVLMSRDIWNLQNTDSTDVLVVGVLLGLVHMARLDAVFLTVVVVTYLIYLNRSAIVARNVDREVGYLLIPPLLTGGGYIVFNLLYFGRLTPVSGAAKSLEGGVGFNWTIIKHLFNLSLEELVFHVIALLAIPLCLVYVAVYVKEQKRAELRGAYLIAVFYLLQMSYYLFLTSSPIETWYLYSTLLVATVTVPVFLDSVIHYLRPTADSMKHVESFAIPFVFIIIVFVVVAAPLMPTEAEGRQSVLYENYQLAQHTNDEFPPEAILAMGDQAGSFGYFSTYRVIHLEGLVNNDSILPYLRQDRLGAYLTHNNVDYLVDHERLSPGYGHTIVSPTHPLKIKRTHVQVYEKCQVAVNREIDTRIWSWSCIRNLK